MSKNIKILVGVLVLFLVLIIVFSPSKNNNIDWTETYQVRDKIPFGLFVLSKEIPSITKSKIYKVSKTPYEYFEENYDYDTLVNDYKIKGTFLNIKDYGNLDEQSAQEILYFVSHGNTAFLSMKTFPENLLDSLNVEAKIGYDMKDSVDLWVENPKVKIKKYSFDKAMDEVYFGNFDKQNVQVLGYQKEDTIHPNFIKINHRGGTIYLHTQPAVFTNYYLLDKNHSEYVAELLSVLPKQDIHWYGKWKESVEDEEGSALQFILSKPALKWAWYLFLIGLFVFAIFNAKRKQRIVPIIKPLENTTIDFTKTIANLYFQEGHFDDLLDKKIIYFLEKIRHDYFLDTTVLDDNFITKLHQKSGKDYFIIEDVVYKINSHRKSPHNSVEEDLINLNSAIEKFLI